MKSRLVRLLPWGSDHLLTQHLFNTCQTLILYALVACGFYLATVSCRHFNFAAGIPFILTPQIIAAMQSFTWPVALLLALGCCALLGVGWRALSGYLFSRGSREGQLLIISLAALAITENAVRLVFGNESVGLWAFESKNLIISRWLSMSHQQLVLVFVGGTIMVALLCVWHGSLFGFAMRGLVESRYGLMLRGYDVPLLENIGAAVGFTLVGIAGVLWAITSPIRPGMGLEIGVIGVVTYTVGPRIAQGLAGLILAACIMAVLRLFIALNFEGDWSMTAMLALLGVGIAFSSARSLLGTRSSKA